MHKGELLYQNFFAIDDVESLCGFLNTNTRERVDVGCAFGAIIAVYTRWYWQHNDVELMEGASDELWDAGCETLGFRYDFIDAEFDYSEYYFYF
jgi:hypothetical protein